MNFETKIADAVRLAVHDDTLRASVLTTGEVFFVVEDSDTEYAKMAQRYGKKRVFLTLNEAYDASTENRGDSIFMSASTTHSLSAGITWSKSRINVIGLDGGGRSIQQGTKVDYTGDGNYAATISITGTRNSFRNLKVTNNGTHANSIAAIIDAGEGTLIENCSVQKLTDLDQTTVADFICRSDSATYTNIEFGFDTLVQTAARNTFWVDGVTKMKNLRMKDCRFISACTSASKIHFKCAANSFLFTNIVENCMFINSINGTQAAIQATVAAESDASNVEGVILFATPHCQSASFATTSTGFVVTMTPTSTTNAFEGRTPA